MAKKPSPKNDRAKKVDPTKGLAYVFVKINEASTKNVLITKYQRPIEALLKKHDLGAVRLGDRMLSADGKVLFIGMDIDLTNATSGIPLLIEKLHEIGVPHGSVLSYTMSCTVRLDKRDRK